MQTQKNHLQHSKNSSGNHVIARNKNKFHNHWKALNRVKAKPL